jgi:plastocyanin
VITVTITGQKGDQSFNPNPAMCATGQTVVWKNADTTTHRIVIPDLGVDTGNIAPGASSAPVSLANVSKPYHCSLHPSMVGALNNATADGGSCGPYGC